MKPIFSCHIAGIPYRKPDLSQLSLGSEVLLEEEPSNPHDPNAIKVMHTTTHLGYIPKELTAQVRELGITGMYVVNVAPDRKWSEVIIAV